MFKMNADENQNSKRRKTDETQKKQEEKDWKISVWSLATRI